MTSRRRTSLQLVEDHLRAEDRHDVAAILDTFTEDCVYRIPAYDVELRGKREVGAFYRAMFESFPDFENVSATVHESARAIFVEVVTERTHEGTWRGLAPTGERFRTTSLAQFPIAAGGLLGGEVVHVNPVDALYRIGALEDPDLFRTVRRLRPLAGRRALVTGATGGIGAAVASALAEAGADLVLAGRDAGRLEQEAARIAGEGTRVTVAPGDLRSVEAVRRVVDVATDNLGAIDVLVNAAGGTRRGPALEVTERDWDEVQEVNLRSVFFLCQAVARRMVDDTTGGVIVNVASLNSAVGNAWAASYAASKGGVAALTRSLALEWADAGIRVNAIGPGMIETAMTEPLRGQPERFGRLLDHIPMGRFGRPDELGGAAVFLASEASSYMTGQVVYVDGGYLCA